MYSNQSINQPIDSSRNDLNASIGAGSMQGIELAEMDLQLFNRLLKVGIIRASPNIKPNYDKQKVVLDQATTLRYLNGWLFGSYMVVLKSVMARKNQDFSIDNDLVKELKDQTSTQARLYNWNYICNELEKVGILIEADSKSLYVAGDAEEIGTLFKRIERYVTRISNDKEVLQFNDFKRDDRDGSPARDMTESAKGRRGGNVNQRKTVKDGVDIMAMDTKREPSETESTLEFILNTLCRALTMKPKQAAALLTNNNQFLTHCIVKGVKGRFEPMLSWYQELYQYSRHLSEMLTIELNQASLANNPKMIRAANQNFEKVLQTISCGCYSQNSEVAQLCLKTLSCIAQDFQGQIELSQLAMNWFQSKDNGCYTINYALKRHNDLAEDVVNCIGHFTDGSEMMQDVYLRMMSSYYPEVVDYFNALNAVFPFLSIKYAQEMQQGDMLFKLVDKTIQYTGQTGLDSPQVKIAALSLLCEIWLQFYSNFQGDIMLNIQTAFQRNCREKENSVRIVAIASMFKLLDKFSVDKYPAAPSLYKQLIFSLIDNPHDQTSREMLLVNFQGLFESVKAIPISLLLEPLIRLNQVNDMFTFVTFDYDFLSYCAQHPKLSLQIAIQMLDLLARQYLNDMCNASAVSVPFMMLCSRFIGTLQCQEFIMKFITISLNQLLIMEGANTTAGTPNIDGSSNKALLGPSPAGKSADKSRRSSSKKDFRISSSKKKKFRNNIPLTQEEQINKKLKKAYIIQMLIKLQALQQDDVNNAMKDMLLSAQKQFRDSIDEANNGIKAALKYWGDPTYLFNQYIKTQEKIEEQERKAYEKLKRQEASEKRMLGYDSDDRSQMNNYQLQQPVKKLEKGTAGRNSMALMPITENQQNLRALHELEMIKKYKKDKLTEEAKKQAEIQRKQQLKRNRLQEELALRRVQMGQMQNIGGVKQEVKALIYQSDPSQVKTNKYKNPLQEQLKLVNLDEEEDRDKEIIATYMKKYHKIWKYLHSRYMNQIYSIKGREGHFDSIKQRKEQISLPEVTKMLKDHGCYPQLIKKEELATLVRLINMNVQAKNSHDLTMMDFSQFLKFIPQLALLMFTRPPIDKSAFPPIACLQAMMQTFEEATRARGKNTDIYQDPDISNFTDKELISALEEKCQQDPNFIVPEGYKKVIEKIPVFKYEVPKCALDLIGPARAAAIEALDLCLDKAVGTHFLEPMVTFEQKTRVKPAIAKQVKIPAGPSYMGKIERKAEESKKPTSQAFLSAAEKRMQALEVKPKLGLALKMQVTKQDLKGRPHYQEVAEVFEEMLQACEKGLTYLPPRQNRMPGQIQNQAKLQKELDDKMWKQDQVRREADRLQRNNELKTKLEKSNFGGRGMPIQEFNKQKTKIDKETHKQQVLKEHKDFQAAHMANKQIVDQKKAEQMEKLRHEQELAERAAKEERKRKASEAKVFLDKQKTKLTKDFEETYKRRDDIILKEEQRKKLEKDNEDRLKNQMSKYINNTKQDREVEKQERADVEAFLKRGDVQQVFDDYGIQLKQMFDFYAAQDTQKDKISFKSEFYAQTLTFKELVRFAYQQKLTPSFVQPEDMVRIYKNLIREQVDNNKAKKDEQSRNLTDSGMLDFSAFQKALIRISLVAQEKLEKIDSLGTQLDEAANKKKQLKEKAKSQHKDLSAKKNAEAEKIEKLRDQFKEDQQNRAQALSKKPTMMDKSQVQQSPRSNSIHANKAAQEKKYMLDMASLQQEEEFFQKWLKQRENLGMIDEQSVSDTGRAFGAAANKKKDVTQKELKDLDKQIKDQQQLSKVKVEKTQVRKKLDLSSISAGTIESLMKYLEIEQGDFDKTLNRKLTMNSARKTISKKQEANQKGSVIEEKTEEDDFGRE